MTKEQAYQQATMKSIGSDPNGTRQDVIYLAMDIYAEYHSALAFDAGLESAADFMNGASIDTGFIQGRPKEEYLSKTFNT